MNKIIITILTITSIFSFEVVWHENYFVTQKEYSKIYNKFYKKINTNISDTKNIDIIWESSNIISLSQRKYAINKYYKLIYKNNYIETKQKEVLVLNNKMWQDEAYLQKERYAQENNINFNKAQTFIFANDYCSTLDLMFYQNWRLPRVDELQELYEAREYLKHNVLAEFWSSTYNRDDFLKAYSVSFNLGGFRLTYKNNVKLVRCIRDIND